MPGPKSVKIRPDSSHPGPSSSRITSLPTSVSAAPRPMPTNASVDSARRKCRAALIGVVPQPAHRRHRDVRERRRELIERQHEQVVRLLVEPQRLRAKMPSDEEVVQVPGAIVGQEPPVGLRGKPHHRARAPVTLAARPGSIGRRSTPPRPSRAAAPRLRPRAPNIPMPPSPGRSTPPPKRCARRCRSWRRPRTAWRA